MARVRTDAPERKKQRDTLKTEVAGEFGVDNMTITAAQEHRRATRSVLDIKQREIDFDDVELKPIGVLLARVNDYKLQGGINGNLQLSTNAHEFGDIVHDAARLSHSDLLVCALFSIPRYDEDRADYQGPDDSNSADSDGWDTGD